MKTFSKFLVGAPLSLATLLAAGCPGPAVTNDTGMSTGSDAGPANDTGTRRDTGTPVALGTCAMPRMITPAVGVAMTVTGNTTGGVEGPLMMADCGNTMATTRSPQDVIAVQIPGTGPAGLTFDLTEGTDATFDTVVQVRTNCTEDPTDTGATCFDDVSRSVVQSAGAVPVMGGTTVYLVVTGYSGGMMTTDSGAYSATLTIVPNSAPTLTAATAVRIGMSRFYVEGTGMDAEMNAQGYTVQFLNAAGAPISIDPMDATAVGPFGFPFDTAPTMAAFTNARSSIDDVPGLGEGPAAAIGTAVTARIIAVDQFGLESPMRDVMITDVAEAAYGAVCDATHICVVGTECTAGTCQPPAAVRTACMGATAVTLTAPTGAMPTVSTQAVMFATGDGAILNECGGRGTERIFNVTVPAGGADLIATTNVAATMMSVDTVVAIRAVCGNSATEVVCDDDYDGAPMGDLRSTAVMQAAASGTYAVIVDSYNALDAAATASLELRLRPVLAAGAACDPMGVMNRCGTSACPSMGAAVCPAM